jgi:hypothetical protein
MAGSIYGDEDVFLPHSVMSSNQLTMSRLVSWILTSFNHMVGLPKLPRYRHSLISCSGIGAADIAKLRQNQITTIAVCHTP